MATIQQTRFPDSALQRRADVIRPKPKLRDHLESYMSQMVMAPSVFAALIFTYGFVLWTLYLSFTDSTLFPSTELAGLKSYDRLWSNIRWQIAYTNFFIFGFFYVSITTVVGLGLAILMDQRIRAEAFFRSILLYPMAISFVVTGLVWRWLLNPESGIERLVQDLGWLSFQFDWIVQRDMAIYAVVFAGVWQASGFVMVLFLAGLRSVDANLVKAAQIDGAPMWMIYWRIMIPSIRPILIAVLIILVQAALKTFELVQALTSGGPGIATTVPAIFVFDVMYARGQLGQGAAGAMMMLVMLLVFLVPYLIYERVRKRRGAA
ncbi:MAG: sugar ABC transporter permease [Pseudomonadota bacterium]